MMLRIALVLVLVSTGWAAEVRRSFTTSDGVRLSYLDAGRGDAIVLVPGWTMPAAVWEKQIRHLSKRRRVVALDPRSQGDSDRPAEGHLPERRARDIKELVDHLDLRNVVLVGWSLAVNELLTYVDLFGTTGVRGLVLVDGGVWDRPDPAMAKAVAGWMKDMQLDRRAHARRFAAMMFQRPQAAAYLDWLAREVLKTPTSTAVTLIYNANMREDWRPVLRKIDVPVLFAHAPGQDRSAQVVKAAIPSARIERFSAAGHALFVDEPERFTRWIEDFARAAR